MTALQLEPLPQVYATGTSKLYGWSDLLAVGDRRAYSTPEFVGRLRTLFGPAEDDSYVFWHRPTGLIVTVYSAQSGPSFGGGPRFSGQLPPPDAEALLELARAQSLSSAPPSPREQQVLTLMEEIQKRLVAPPAAGRDKGAAKELFRERHALDTELADLRAPEGYPKIVRALHEALLSARVSDWERTFEYEGDVCREGVRDSMAFEETLGSEEGLAFLLDQVDAAGLPERQVSVVDRYPFTLPRGIALDYWERHRDETEFAAEQLRRLRVAWEELVEALEHEARQRSASAERLAEDADRAHSLWLSDWEDARRWMELLGAGTSENRARLERMSKYAGGSVGTPGSQ